MRQLTPVEHARVKGIPESLIAGVPATVAHEILGQSVIFPAFEAVGLAVGQCLQRQAPALRVVPPVARRPDRSPTRVRRELASGGEQLSLLG